MYFPISVLLLVELQCIGSTAIYSNLNKIILTIKRWSLMDTRLHITVILEHLQLKDLTSTMCLELKIVYDSLTIKIIVGFKYGPMLEDVLIMLIWIMMIKKKLFLIGI